MNEPVITITSAFIIGLLGGIHCVGMCGGIMNALSFAIKDQNATKGQKKAGNNISFILLLYNLGRVFSYSLAGALVGGLGMLLQGPVGILGPGLRIFAGMMMIAMGLYLAGWWRGLAHMESLGNAVLWKRLQPVATQLIPVSNPPQAFLLGILWGWLPCGLVYSTLTLAGSFAQWQQSALIMASFGLGTVPIMFITGTFATRFRTFLQKSAIRGIAAVMIIGFGVWTMTPPIAHIARQYGY